MIPNKYKSISTTIIFFHRHVDIFIVLINYFSNIQNIEEINRNIYDIRNKDEYDYKIKK